MPAKSATGKKAGGTGQGVEDLDFMLTWPHRRHFVREAEFHCACFMWVLLLLSILCFSLLQCGMLYRNWGVYEGTEEAHMMQFGGKRIPYMDVCEDRLAKGVDKAEPPLVVNGPSDIRIQATCHWFLNGEPYGVGQNASASDATRMYFEMGSVIGAPPVTFDPTKPHFETTEHALPNEKTATKVWREEGSDALKGKRRYRCFKFEAPGNDNTVNTSTEDRLVVKWAVQVEGHIPRDRLRDKGSKRHGGSVVPGTLLGGLLYRMSLSEDPTNLWALHIEGVYGVLHDLECARNVLVSGSVHHYEWAAGYSLADLWPWEFGSAFSRRGIDTFEAGASSFDAESGCFRNNAYSKSTDAEETAESDKAYYYEEETVPGYYYEKGTVPSDGKSRNRTEKTMLIFRVSYGSMDVKSTIFKCDSAPRALLTISSLVAMLTLLSRIHLLFDSVEKTKPDKLTLKAPFRALLSGSNVPEDAQDEEEPLLAAE